MLSDKEQTKKKKKKNVQDQKLLIHSPLLPKYSYYICQGFVFGYGWILKLDKRARHQINFRN